MSLFPTKFVADTGCMDIYTDSTIDAVLKVNGTTVLNETYSPAAGVVSICGLRAVLEAAIYGELKTGGQDHASAIVGLTAGSTNIQTTLYASRLRNPRDPQGTKQLMVAGDLVAVANAQGALITPALYTTVSGPETRGIATPANGAVLGDDIRIWVEQTPCPERAVAVRFLNRYDVPQTMMTPIPLDIKPGVTDQTALMRGQYVRYSVEQNDEYTLRSGRVHSMLEYASWHDLVTSRKAEVLISGQWLPILVTKSNYTQAVRSMGLTRVEISFKMADPRQGI